MGLRINQNIAAFNAYRNLNVTDNQLSKSLEKLSSGYRINRAADDAAGLAISEGLRAQVGGLKVAVRNAQDAVSVVQTAEGALAETHAILQRMRDLSVQASNGSQDQKARDAANTEFAALNAELDRIANTTSFGSQKLLDGTFGTVPAKVTGFDADNSIAVTAADDFTINVAGSGAVTVELGAGPFTGAEYAAHLESAIKTALTAGTATQKALADKINVSYEAVGAGASITISADIADQATKTIVLADGTGTPLADMAMGTTGTASGTGGVFQVGANNSSAERISVSISKADSVTLATDVLSLSTTSGAQSAITALDTAIGTVSTTRANLGALQNRFEHTINNLNVAVENLSASESRIRDTDMAAEMVSFTRAQILSQAGTAMLAQANQVPASVLQLLG